MRSASPLTSTIVPFGSHTIMPSGAASTSWRNGRSVFLIIGGEDAEHGAGIRVVDPDPAAVSLDRELAERKPEAPVGARRRLAAADEPLEHLLAQLHRHARAAVDDGELAATLACRRRHADARPFR